MDNLKVLAGVSGGPDSMCMLNLYKNDIAVVCHVNYQKRSSATRDQKIVEAFCKKENIKLEILKIDESQYLNCKNFQALARKLRYDFYLEIAQKYNLDKVYLGHNFNDFLESAFMQKKRSQKLLFYGIKKENYYQGLKIFRPLIEKSRTWIENYLLENKIAFGIDESNFELIYERNIVRNEMKNWTKEKLEIFKKEILELNNKNQLLYEDIKHKFMNFQKNEFDIDWFKKQSDIEKYHLIYNFLVGLNLNSSDAKILAIIKFIDLNSNKLYRLKDKWFLKIEHKKIRIIEK